jgi:hypothetical protein
LAITGIVAGVAPRSWLTGGLVLLVVLDVILVWGDRQVEPTMNALQSAAPPTIGQPLPELQLVDFGSATMGWLDFAAPALLGLLVQRRAVAGVATGIAASLLGLLLLVTSPIAATPPVLVGLIAGRKLRGRLPTVATPKTLSLAASGVVGARPNVICVHLAEERAAAWASVRECQPARLSGRRAAPVLVDLLPHDRPSALRRPARGVTA